MKESVRDLWLQAGGDSVNEEHFRDEIIERFAELIVDRCADSVIESDPSEKMILHEPYRTVMDNVLRTFDEDPEDQ